MAGTSDFQSSGNDLIQILRSKVLLGSEFSRSDPTQVVQLLRCVMRVLEFCVPPCRMIINGGAMG